MIRPRPESGSGALHLAPRLPCSQIEPGRSLIPWRDCSPGPVKRIAARPSEAIRMPQSPKPQFETAFPALKETVAPSVRMTS